MNRLTLINMSIARSYGGKVLYERNSAGMLMLLAALEKAGLKTRFREHFLVSGLSLRGELARFMRLVDPAAPVVGIGCHSVHLPFVLEAARAVKKKYPGKKVVLGGGGPSPLARELCEKFDFIDAVAYGEGEGAIVDIARRGAKGFRGVKGLVCREGGKAVVNPPRPPIQNLDSLPLPAYHRMDFAQYKVPTVITSRGCPYGCHFCSLSVFWGKKVRCRSIDSVMEELTLLARRYGVKYVFFGDATFIMDRARTLELCRRLKAERLGLKWECLVRLDRVDEELMREMSAAGCEAVFYGLESGSDRVLKRVKSGVTLAEGLAIIKKSCAHFRTVEPGLMWGFPFETLADFRKTLAVRNYLKDELNCEVQLRWLEPYPDTALFSEFKSELFLPERESVIYRPELAGRTLKGKKFYGSRGELGRICLPSEVTGIRTVVAAAHVASLCGPAIKASPELFPDYYRYKTPDLARKLALARKFSLY